MNLTLLKNFPFLKQLRVFSAKRLGRPHQQVVAQRDWIRILIGAAIVGLAITVQSIFVFLGANTEKTQDSFREAQINKHEDIFDRQELQDIQTFFQSRERELERLRGVLPSTNDPAVVESESGTSTPSE